MNLSIGHIREPDLVLRDAPPSGSADSWLPLGHADAKEDPTPALLSTEAAAWSLGRPGQLRRTLRKPASRQRAPQHQTYNPQFSDRLPLRFQPPVVARAAIVMHLHEHRNLTFRQISKLLHLKSSETARAIYGRGCTLRDLFTAELPPQIRAAWRSQLTSALFPSADIGPTPAEDRTPDR